MRKLLISVLCVMYIAIVAASEGVVETPLNLTKCNFKSLPTSSLASYQHIVVHRNFNEDDLEKLKGFTQVKTLDFYHAMNIDDVTKIPPMGSVQALNLRTRPVSDFDIDFLVKNFKNLHILGLSHTGIFGTTLGLLEKLDLDILDLSNTPISDKSYVTGLLEKSPKLIIYLHETSLKKEDFINNGRVRFEEYTFG